MVCQKCSALYYRDATKNLPCNNCGTTTLNKLEGRIILRCKQCGLTQNQTVYKQMQNEDQIKCQNSTCNGSVKAILLDQVKSSPPEVSTPQPRPQAPPMTRRLVDMKQSEIKGIEKKGVEKKIPEVKSSELRIPETKVSEVKGSSTSPQINLLNVLASQPRAPTPGVRPSTNLPFVSGPKPKDHSGFGIGDYILCEGEYYEAIEKIGTGGMGAIYKGRNTSTGKFVAIKEFYYSRYHDPETGENRCELYWLREQQMIKIQSQSPEKGMHLIGGVKLNQNENPEYYLIIEFVQGIPLDKWYAENYKTLQDLTIPELRKFIKFILMPIARHMYHVHEQGVIHRDLTVQNIMIIQDRTDITPIVIDWGVAKQVEKATIYNPRKPYYIASAPEATGIRNRGTPPEVMAGFAPIAVTDVYMLGHIMYYLFSGGHYCGTAATHEDFVLHPGDLNPDLPSEFNKLVEYMTQYEPADRMPNMVKVYEALDWLYHNTELLEHPSTTSYQYSLYCEYNESFIPLHENQVIELGRDEILQAGTTHDYDGHLYNGLIPKQSGQFQFALYVDKGYLFIRDLYSKLGTFLSNLTMPNQQIHNEVSIKGLDNVFIMLSDANLNKTTIEVPFIAPDGKTYRIPFKVVRK